MMRYVVKHYSEAEALGWQTCGCQDHAWLLFDTVTDPPTFIDSDGGEPEDQLLVRDWSWVPELLNEHAAREAKLHARLEAAETHVNKVVDLLDRHLGDTDLLDADEWDHPTFFAMRYAVKAAAALRGEKAKSAEAPRYVDHDECLKCGAPVLPPPPPGPPSPPRPTCEATGTYTSYRMRNKLRCRGCRDCIPCPKCAAKEAADV